MSLLVIGAGNAFRRDDAAGLEVARRLRALVGPDVDVIEAGGDLSALCDLWSGRDCVILLDAVRSGADGGTVHRLDALAQSLPAGMAHGSTHGLGIADAVELARALGTLPASLIVYGIEGCDFGNGTGLSPRVALAVESLAQRIARQIAARSARVNRT